MWGKHLKTIWQSWRQDRKAPKDAPRTRDEYEFQPGYLEIIERPPSPWARRTAMALTLTLVAILAWAIIGHLDIHARAMGRIIISSHSKVIQSPEAGEIAKINVRDGQRVKAGDILITLNPVGIDSQVRELEEQLIYNQLEQARFEALLTDSPLRHFTKPARASIAQATSAREHLASEWKDITEKLEDLDSEISVNRANQHASNAEIASLKKLASNINTRLDASRTLVKRKQFPKMELLVQEQDWLQVQLSLTQKKEEIAVLKARHTSLEEQRQSYLAQVRREYYDKLSEVKRSLAVINQQLIQANERRRLHIVRAPVSGVVQQLAIHTLGGVVQPAQQLLVIVPDNAPLEADVMVLNKDVGFVHSGQPVEVKVDSFPYTRYGTIKGTLSHISRDAVQNEQMGLVFPARVKLSRSTIVVNDREVPLQAGMSINAEIRTGDRRVIDYLLSPIQQYQSEALRER